MKTENGSLIKTEILLDDSGKEFDTGRVTRKALYLEVLSKEEALKRFDAGEKVYFIYQDERIYHTDCRKVCHDRDYLADHYDCYHEVCGTRMPLNRLTDKEYNILNNLATKTGMDCWFWLVERGGTNGKPFRDVVKNLEEGKCMALRNALPMFAEGVLDLNFWAYGLTEENKDLFLQLLDRFGIRDEYKRLKAARAKNDPNFAMSHPLEEKTTKLA